MLTNAIIITFAAQFLLQIVSASAVAIRFRKRNRVAPLEANAPKPFVTIIRPCSGVDPFFEETIQAGFQTGDWPCKFVFCLRDAHDAALPVLQVMKAKHPDLDITILSEEKRISGNPKLNNVAQAEPHFGGDFVLIVDSNVLFEPNYLPRMMANWREGIGLLSSPPAGMRAESFAARVEAGFLNGYQDRWQVFSDILGNGFAQGKVLFWRRELLESTGLKRLGEDLAEDVASTKATRRAGLKVKLLERPVWQPLGHRRFADVWDRQKRWARTRRFGFPWLYVVEVFSLAASWWIFGILLIMIGQLSVPMFFALIALWYLAEFVLCARASWPRKPKDWLAWLVRDAIGLPIWISGYTGRGFSWQGNEMSIDEVAQEQSTK